MSYAARTRVAVEDTRMEIEKTLRKYRADQFASAIDDGARAAWVQFRLAKRVIRFEMRNIPKQPQQERSRWRALLLCIKGKLEAVSSNIETFDEAFMAHVVMPDGRRFAEAALPAIEHAASTGKLPHNLLEFKGE